MQIVKEQAVIMFGSQSALARALGISPAAVAQWKPGKPIPEAQALKIRYQLKREEFEGPSATPEVSKQGAA